MPERIEYWDTWKEAREKINWIIDFAEDNIPSIWENWNRYLWDRDTEISATWPEWEQWPRWPEWPQWPAWDDWTDIMSEKEYEETPWTESDDIIYFLTA